MIMFICVSLNCAVSSPDYITPEDKMINAKEHGKKRSCSKLIYHPDFCLEEMR